jgi:hypothetical protein
VFVADETTEQSRAGTRGNELSADFAERSAFEAFVRDEGIAFSDRPRCVGAIGKRC